MLTLDIYDLCCFFSKRAIYLFGKFLFDRQTDIYFLGIFAFILSVLFTSNKNWANALDDEEQERLNIAVPFIIMISAVISYVWISGIVKG